MRNSIFAVIFCDISQQNPHVLITIKNILLVGTGGFAGSTLRYIISVLMMKTSVAGMFPWGTFIVNSAGSLLIGFFMAVLGSNPVHLLLVTGFCGGFTTFSTFSAETFGLLRDGNYGHGLLYITVSVVLCVFMVWAGMYIGQKLIK